MTRRTVLGAVAVVSFLSLAACTPTTAPTAATPTSPVPTTVVATSAPTTVPSPTPTPDVTPVVTPGAVAGVRHAALFGSARAAGGTTYLSFDLVLFLTGGEAEDAAEAEGEESPPPNDYFILNHSPKLREYAVAPGVGVAAVMDAGGALCPDLVCPPLTMDAWLAAIIPSQSAFRSTPYWITVEDATITGIEQQYVP